MRGDTQKQEANETGGMSDMYNNADMFIRLLVNESSFIGNVLMLFSVEAHLCQRKGEKRVGSLYNETLSATNDNDSGPLVKNT